MKFLPSSLIIIFLLDAVISVPNDVQKLTAVSPPNIAVPLYLRIRNEEPCAETPLAMGPDTKNRICHHITGSGFFTDTMGKKRVCIYEVYNELRNEYLDIFNDLYEPSVSPTSGEDKVYTNQTRLVDVHLNEQDQEPIKEYIFICLTFGSVINDEEKDDDDEDEEDEETFIRYFISREYNLSDTPNPYIAGRFIFTYADSNKTKIILIAVAEEPAKSLSTPGAEVERSYLQTRANNEPAENESEDPICRLNEHERLRVCTLVLSSAYFAGELKFVPEYDYVDKSNCMKKEITFQDNQASLVADGKRYEEWMIGCRPKEYYASFQAEYFVSRFYNSTNQVFLYRQGRGFKIVLENLFGRVRFVI